MTKQDLSVVTQFCHPNPTHHTSTEAAYTDACINRGRPKIHTYLFIYLFIYCNLMTINQLIKVLSINKENIEK